MLRIGRPFLVLVRKPLRVAIIRQIRTHMTYGTLARRGFSSAGVNNAILNVRVVLSYMFLTCKLLSDKGFRLCVAARADRSCKYSAR